MKEPSRSPKQWQSFIVRDILLFPALASLGGARWHLSDRLTVGSRIGRYTLSLFVPANAHHAAITASSTSNPPVFVQKTWGENVYVLPWSRTFFGGLRRDCVMVLRFVLIFSTAEWRKKLAMLILSLLLHRIDEILLRDTHLRCHRSHQVALFGGFRTRQAAKCRFLCQPGKFEPCR
jgi:hypothetical protein